MPELRRIARGEAGDDAVDRLPPVPVGGRPVSHRASAATSRTTRRATAASRRSRSARVGTLALGGASALPWQVVGYVERCEIPERRRGRADLLARVPALSPQRGLRLHRRRRGRLELDGADHRRAAAFGDGVKHEGALYRKLYDYTGKVTYVLGEFYWHLTRDQRTANTDYQGTGAASTKRLNREETEGAGSAGGRLVGRRDARR